MPPGWYWSKNEKRRRPKWTPASTLRKERRCLRLFLIFCNDWILSTRRRAADPRRVFAKRKTARPCGRAAPKQTLKGQLQSACNCIESPSIVKAWRLPYRRVVVISRLRDCIGSTPGGIVCVVVGRLYARNNTLAQHSFKRPSLPRRQFTITLERGGDKRGRARRAGLRKRAFLRNREHFARPRF